MALLTVVVESIATPKLLGVLFVLWLLYRLSRMFSSSADPLSHIPGPRWNAISMIPYARHLLAGTTVQNTLHLHEKYGDVVRIAPNEVSFISADTAFTEIYGFRTGKLKGHANMAKDPVWYTKPFNGAASLIQANDEDHARGRRILSHAFSEKALTSQEPLLQTYFNMLIDGLRNTLAESPNKPIDMVKWYNWTTFDIIGDLTFGESFGCLENCTTHENVALLFESLKSLRMLYIQAYFPWLKLLGNYVIDKSVIQKRHQYLVWIASQVKKRVAKNTTRPDFIKYILESNQRAEQKLTQAEIDSNVSGLTTAGSETTATVLSGTTYLLCKNPNVYEKLRDEIRGSLIRYEDITLEATVKLPYLTAVILESLRCFPPVPVGFIRRVGPGGEHISGYFIPENTAVSVSHYAAYHSERNFKSANDFIPERWLNDPAYASDKQNALQPFNVGPRSCIGRNLAYAELRIIISKIVWSFDMELDERSHDWLDRCRVMRLWSKPELLVKLIDRTGKVEGRVH